MQSSIPNEESIQGNIQHLHSSIKNPFNQEILVEEVERVIANPNTKNFEIFWNYSKGDLIESERLLDEWKGQTCQNYEFGHWMQALIHRNKGKINDGLKFFKYCHIIDDKNPEYLKQIAKTLNLLGRYKTAQKIANDLISGDSANDWLQEVYYILGCINQNQGNLEEAEKFMRKALEIKFSRKVGLALSQIMLSLGKNDEALNFLQKYTENNSFDSTIGAELGALCLQMKKTDYALHYFGATIAQDPANCAALMGLGAISQEFSDSLGALNRYKDYCNIDSNCPEVWNNIGMCYFEKESHLSAISCLKKALYLNPLSWEVHFNIGLVFLAMDQYSSAFHHILVSIKHNSQNGEAYMYLGICLKELGDNSNAYNAYSRATKLDPENHLIFLNFAIFLADSDNEKTFEMAKQIFQKHNQLYTSNGSPLEGEIKAQRSALSSVLGIAI